MLGTHNPSLEQKAESKRDMTPTISVSPVSSIGFFSLKEICMNDLLSTEHKIGKEHIKLLQGLLHDEYMQFKQKKLKCLLEAIVQGDSDTALKMAETYPILLLEKLEEKDVIITPSGQKSAKKTPYQMALAEDDSQLATKLRNQLIIVADEKEADAQFNEQRPKNEKQDWEVDEQKRWQPIFDQLESLTQAIRHSKRGDITSSGFPEDELTVRAGSEVAIALTQFRSLLDAMLNEIVTTGRHFNPNLFQRAFQIYEDHYVDYFENDLDNRVMLFWKQVIGYIERLFPANFVQAASDGFYKTEEKLRKGMPQGRSFKFKIYDSGSKTWIPWDFYPLSSSLLGYSFAIHGLAGICQQGCDRSTSHFLRLHFEAYVNQKQQAYRAYTAPSPSM